MEVVKGFKDIYGEEALKREKIKEQLIKKFKIYGFLPVETPIIEYESFAKEGQYQETISDIFRLKDKGNRSLALRYELTFQLKRITLNKKLPFRRYQIGEVFRDEPTSTNRFRQFTQCDIDVVGSTIRDEAEILKLFSEILKELQIDFTIYINNRKLINEILEEQKIAKENQLNVIKELDKLDKLEENTVKENLKKYKAEKIIELFKKPEDYFKKYKAFKEIEELKKYCKEYGVDVKFSPFLARGLSYYNGSIFEIKTKKMKESVAGGGSYLVNEINSTGISFGLERLTKLAKVKIDNILCIVISINQDSLAIKTAENLRKNNISCFIMNKISKALEYADNQKIPFVIFIGNEEAKAKKLKLRNMKDGKEELLTEYEIIQELSKKYAL